MSTSAPAATEVFTIFWFTGICCDGCSVAVLGDDSCVPIERLLAGTAEGLPRIDLVHPLLSVRSGHDFVETVERGTRDECGPFGLVVESAIGRVLGGGASYGSFGQENGEPVDVGTWVSRLARHAQFVMAMGDCAVFGGPHAPEGSNPSGSTGVELHLGVDYRSRAGLPVIHLPGCPVPHVAIASLIGVLQWLRGDGPLPQLDDLNRPRGLYD